MRNVACVLLTAVVLAPGCASPATGEGPPPVFGAEPAQIVTSAEGGLVVTLWTAPSPPTKGVNAMRLLVSDPRGVVVENASVRATAWMPAHGHSASVNPTVTEAGEGVYDVAPVVFYMEGRWELRGEATTATSASDSFVAAFDVP